MTIMRILHVAWDIESYTGGGERAVLSMVSALNLVADCELLIASKRVGPVSGDTVSEVPTKRIGILFGPFDNPIPNIRQLRVAIRDIDILHVHQAHTVILDFIQILKRPNQRLVLSDHGGGGPNLSRLLRRHSRIDGAIAHSQSAGHILNKFCDTVSYIPLPIDTRLFRILPAMPVKEYSVLCVGRLIPHKGFDVAIRALPPGYSLTIVGKPYDIEYYNYLQTISASKEVYFVTDADDNRLIREINAASVFVAPSVYVDYRGRHHPKTELFGLSPVEAAACGRPVVVSTAVPALREAIRQKRVTGVEYEWNNMSQLSAAIVQMASSDISVKNRHYVEQEYASADIGRRLLAFYERLLT